MQNEFKTRGEIHPRPKGLGFFSSMDKKVVREKISDSTLVTGSYDNVLAYHKHDLSIERGIPAAEHCKVKFLERSFDKEILSLNFPKGILLRRWVFERRLMQHGVEGKQIKGPFIYFEHHIKIKKHSQSEVEVIDEAVYKIPLGKLGKWILGHHIRKRLLRLFKYRHHVLKKDIEQQALYANSTPLKILLSGSHGFIGSHLKKTLTLFGHSVVSLVRGPSNNNQEIQWDPKNQKVDLRALEGFDVVIHLGGDNIASCRWTKSKKDKIYRSRIESTAFLATLLNKLQHPPRSFLCASASGFYGKRPGEKLDEDSSVGKGFLAHVVEAWETSARLCTKARVVTLRFGVVIGRNGGIFKKMLLPYKMGLGAVLGTGREFMSWIALQDVAYQVMFVIHQDTLLGSVNIVSPSPVTGGELSRILAHVLHRPVFFKIPSWIIKLVFQELGEELLLADAQVYPGKLTEAGARFGYATLQITLESIL
jgi:uncharacterized protein (TIGR01777 family)